MAARRIRLADVAERANVSAKTVSNVINGFAHVTDETRQRVHKAIDELGYQPNLTARSLRTGHTDIIALAVPRLKEQYFGELADNIVWAAEKRGYTVLIESTNGRAERERKVLSGLEAQFVDGLLLNPVRLEWDDIRDSVIDQPIVLLGESLNAAGETDHVAIDNIAAARAATEHLLNLGRSQIGVVGAPSRPRARLATMRLQGFKDALRAANVPIDPALIRPAKVYGRPAGADTMSALLKERNPPDAVFCFNDALALGALRALHDHDVAVPDEVAVVGFDDIDEAQFATPTLTTVAPDKKKLAQLAVDALIKRITDGRHAPPQEIRAPFTLIERESTLGEA